MITLSQRVQQLVPSATLALSARANELKKAGKNIINLGVGEPDFDTPDHIKNAAKKALDEGFTKYTAVDGILGLKEAIIHKFKRDNGLDYQPKQITVSSGGKQAFFNLVQALLNSGDEMIIPAPYWVSYPEIVSLAGAKPVIVAAGIDQRYKITAAQLEKAITPKTKCVIFNSPSNPSGMAYTRSEWAALAEVLLKHPDIVVATDDMYESILWTQEPFSNILMVCPELYDRTLILHGVSKAYAMTGWRIGYSAGPEKLIKAMSDVQSQCTSNANSIAQKAAECALKDDQACVETMRKAYEKRHAFVFDALLKMSGVTCLPSDGTFYIFPSVQKWMDETQRFDSDVALSEYLLNEAGVAVVPGSAFGAPGCLRVSFATDEATLHEAMKRFSQVFG